MNFTRLIILLTFVVLNSLNCGEGDKNGPDPAFDAMKRRFPQSVQSGKFFERDSVKYLWGGTRENQHFVVDNLTLKPEQFHFGIGRETFPALLQPEFVTPDQAEEWLSDAAQVLGLFTADVAKAYPLFLLERHEVVNDTTAEGAPILVVYCNLANLAAIYNRTIAGRVYTFGQSGYTYFDPDIWEGADGFVLWDRETESLWWPLIEKAVSGPMLNTLLNAYDRKKWRQTTWGEWRQTHPNSLVLERNQDFERPENWPRYENTQPTD